MEGGSFNITNTVKPTNKDVVVAFSPAQNTEKYTYVVVKDNVNKESKQVNSKEISNITLSETGNYKIIVKTYDKDNNENTITSGVYIIDKEAPTITVSQKNIKIKKGELVPGNIVNVKDNYSTNLEITNNLSEINLNRAGHKTLTYTAVDEAGNQSVKDIDIQVAGLTPYLFIAWTIIIITSIFLLTFIYKVYKNFKVVKRIEPFTITTHKNKELSLADKIIFWYQNLLKKWGKSFEKSDFARRYSKRLEKYTTVSTNTSGMDIFVSKIVFALLLLFLAFTVKAITFKILPPLEILLSLTVGFFLFDIIYFFRYGSYRKKLENDLLSAIIVMNNAFKSGRSITQSIDIVSKEIPGEIGKEFAKMSLELSYGLGIDTVFKRFADRIKLDEVNYLTASLTILNKTGGNIIEVFSSIEKTMFDKKKLKLELKSLTSSSRIIVYVLFTVPFLFILFISIISPGYFSPFITTSLGRIILALIAIYYIIFIIIVRKIMKVVI